MYSLRIKEYRMEKKWSQEDLSIMSGLSQAEISNIENHEKSPSLQTIIKISKAFEICPHILVDFCAECEMECINQFFLLSE